VCHSVTYKKCYSCHVQLSDDGAPFVKTEPSQMAFKIGLNPIKSEARPYKYVVVRHVPIDGQTFEYYGTDPLPNFDARPTWTYATPHDIQRKMPQNANCKSCHNNKELHLTEEAVAPDEREANQNSKSRPVEAGRAYAERYAGEANLIDRVLDILRHG
jgi:hypothetical protein